MQTVVVSAREVEELLPMDECIDVMAGALETLGRGDGISKYVGMAAFDFCVYPFGKTLDADRRVGVAGERDGKDEDKEHIPQLLAELGLRTTRMGPLELIRFLD